MGIENNHQMRVCREDDPAQQNRRRELRGQAAADQAYYSSNDNYKQQQQQQQQAPMYPQYGQQGYPAMPDQQQGFGQSPRYEWAILEGEEKAVEYEYRETGGRE